MAQVKKPKRDENKVPKGLEPKKSIFANPIVKVVIFSVVGALMVFLISDQVGSKHNFSTEEGILFSH